MFELDIERALQRHCQIAPQYQTLLAQWTFDKQLVAGALKSVPITFPHYSLHDDSHSDTILRQIARILGSKRLERLSPTDLWLLLEAAYHHDIGMVVPEQTMQAWWSSQEFDEFLERIKAHPDKDIQHAAQLLNKRTGGVAKTTNWPFEVRRALVLIMAEYARAKHASQSRNIVATPALIGMETPRNALVPQRFWGLIGRICESHGKDFGALNDLPQVESGFGVDDAHPRFVAAMLRLGDLLDLDDGRFCPVLSRTFGGLPPSSKAHEEKHHSIEEFYVGTTEIRVVAECKSTPAFDVTEQWLTWLRDELRNLNTSWSRISPEPDFGVIPSAGKIEARLVDYLPLPDGRRPRFDVDKLAMLEFVKGAGLYANPMACIEELLQNAVDATLLRVWVEDRKRWLDLAKSGRNNVLDELREDLRRFPIDVEVKRLKRSEEENHWHVVISDQGSGIRREDISYLQSIGSSRKNPRRLERVREMPEWMKPSGYFGIGLQSVFMFTDRIEMLSRADDALETLMIVYEQSPGHQEPQLLVKVVPPMEGMNKPGTRIELVLREELVRRNFSYDAEDAETVRTVNGYDPILDDELPVLPSQVRDSVRRFARGALVPIRLDQQSIETKMSPREFFDPATGIALSLKACPNGSVEFSYRGRKAKLSGAPFPHLDVSVNWHKGDAAGILSVNRQAVRETASEMVRAGIDMALQNVIQNYHKSIIENESTREELQYLALYFQICRNTKLSQYQSLPNLDQWKELPVLVQEGVTYGELVNADEVKFIEDPRIGFLPNSERPSIESSGGGTLISLQMSSWTTDLFSILRNHFIVLRSVNRIDQKVLRESYIREWIIRRIRDGRHDIIQDDVFKYVLNDAADSRYGRTRRTIPCRNCFRAMALQDGAEAKLLGVIPVLSMLTPRAIFPFHVGADGKLSLAGIEKLIDFTYENRASPGTEKHEIAKAVLELILCTDGLMQSEWTSSKRIDYSVDECRRKLEKTYGLAAS